MTAIRKREWTTGKGEHRTAWLVDYKDGSGVRRQKQFVRKKDAEAWRVDAGFEVSQGTHTPSSQSVTIREAAAKWLKSVEARGCKRSTLRSYGQLSRLHIVPFIGGLRLNALTRAKVNEYRDLLVSSGRSPAMVRKSVKTLSLIINEAVEKSLVNQNVVHGVRLPSSEAEAEKILVPEREELKALLAACKEDERALMMVLIYTGIRAGELRALRWADIDLPEGKLSVAQSADLWNEIGPPKSAAGYRTIPLPKSLVSVLKAWKLACPPSELDLVFPSSKGTVFGYQNMLRRVFFPIQIRAGLTRQAQDKLGLPKFDGEGLPVLTGKFGFHALRHAAASGWIEQRVDLKRLQSWLGHANIQITLDTYGHLIRDDAKDREIAEAVERSLLS